MKIYTNKTHFYQITESTSSPKCWEANGVKLSEGRPRCKDCLRSHSTTVEFATMQIVEITVAQPNVTFLCSDHFVEYRDRHLRILAGLIADNLKKEPFWEEILAQINAQLGNKPR